MYNMKRTYYMDVLAALTMTACGHQAEKASDAEFTDHVEAAHDGQQPDEAEQ